MIFLKKSQIYNKRISKQNRNVRLPKSWIWQELLSREKSMSKTYHFIGIKGSGMSALALMLHQMGHKVQGSDVEKTTLLNVD